MHEFTRDGTRSHEVARGRKGSGEVARGQHEFARGRQSPRPGSSPARRRPHPAGFGCTGAPVSTPHSGSTRRWPAAHSAEGRLHPARAQPRISAAVEPVSYGLREAGHGLCLSNRSGWAEAFALRRIRELTAEDEPVWHTLRSGSKPRNRYDWSVGQVLWKKISFNFTKEPTGSTLELSRAD